MDWQPKPGAYSGENEYSIRPHKPNSVGATPTSATNVPMPQTIVLAERSVVIHAENVFATQAGIARACPRHKRSTPYQALNGMVHMAVLCLEMGFYTYFFGVMVARQTLTL